MKINTFPIFCDIGITESCLFRCKMCKSWQSPKNHNELSIDEWKNFIRSLEEFNSHEIKLHFAGGEPLLKEGICDIIRFAKTKGFITVMVSNGFLIDDIMADEIASSGLDVLSLSLDSLDAKTHDFLRGQQGSFSRLMRAIDLLGKKRAKGISILSVISGKNIDQIAGLVEWANSNDALSSIYLQAIGHPIACPKDDFWYENAEFAFLWPNDKTQVQKTIDQLIYYKMQGYKISNSAQQLETFRKYFLNPQDVRSASVCSQGDYVVSVRPSGDVFLCGTMAPIGNIRAARIAQIWNSPEAASVRKRIHQCRENCLVALNCFEDKSLL